MASPKQTITDLKQSDAQIAINANRVCMEYCASVAKTIAQEKGIVCKEFHNAMEWAKCFAGAIEFMEKTIVEAQ